MLRPVGPTRGTDSNQTAFPRGIYVVARKSIVAAEEWMDRRIHRGHVQEYASHGCSLGDLAAGIWGADRASVASLVEEFRAFGDTTQYTFSELSTVQAPYPVGFGLTYLELEALYVVTRIHRPATIVETGIANGSSSAVFLAALDRNGSGTLYSIDPGPDVGGFVPAKLRPRWIVLHDSAANALAHWERTRPIDLFHHDSLHTYRNMRSEFSNAAKFGSDRLAVMSDDVLVNDAFHEFCTEQGRPYSVLGKNRFEGFCAIGPAVAGTMR